MIGAKKTTRRLASLSLLFFSLLSFAAAQPALHVTSQDYEDYSRVIITFPSDLPFTLERDGSLLLVKIQSRLSFRLRADPVQSRLVKSFNWVKSNDLFIVVIQLQDERFRYDSFRIERKRQLVLDFYDQTGRPAGWTAQSPPPPAPPESEIKEETPATVAAGIPPELSPPPAKGIRTIIIDPGHGGLEVGAKGQFGTLEKDVTLAISRKLKAVIERNLSFNVELTRDKDTDVSLGDRASIANNQRAELFISIHANSSYRRNANGSETFFLSLNASDEEARRLAYLENNSANLDRPIDNESKDEIMMILWDMAQSAYLKQSQRLAEIIQDELNSLLGTKDRGIKQAPFKVLTGVACPAVLVEVAFISNPEEEKGLVREDFQQNVAQAIYRGLVRYIKLMS
ncbi:MAG TPA: N-acetylmuramoyl-L-alanine amidase [Candidatus Desulfaltia sp.]|nr:N-acetylmuramoyl-L-alanine amidase [Candidatus Desulfaltia sp.]